MRMPNEVQDIRTRLRLRRELCRLFAQLSRQRRSQLLVVLALMLFSSLAEIISLASVIPFLAVLAEPQQIFIIAKNIGITELMGWRQPSDLLLPLCLAFAIAALLSGLIRILALRVSILSANAIGSDLSVEVYRRTLNQPYLNHLRRNSGDLISAITQEIEQVIVFVKNLLNFASASLISVFLIFSLLLIDLRATFLIAGVVCGSYGLILFVSRNRVRFLGSNILVDQSQRVRCLQEGLGAIRDVIINNLQSTYVEVYSASERRLRQLKGNADFLALSPRYAIESFGLVAIALAALGLTGSRSGIIGALPILGALALGAQRLLPLIQLIYSSWSSFKIDLPALNSLLEYLEQPLEIPDPKTSVNTLRFTTHIQLQSVNFRYSPQEPWILRDLHLTIRRGECIGIVGRTGSGKSTLVDLIMGLIEPNEGSLLVDGTTVYGDNLTAWRSNIAHVPQTIFLADTSIAENIALGLPSHRIDKQLLESAAKQAQVEDFIHSLPLGFSTPVGERGVRLSGGQCQRIGIARALYKQTSVLILDEATSALDEATEAALMKSINALSENLTILMIAHRLSSLKYCDRSVRVANGSLQNI